MIWDIVVKLRNGVKLSRTEEKQLNDFIIRKLSVEKIMTTFSDFSGYNKQQWKEYFSGTCEFFLKALLNGRFDNILTKLEAAPDREVQLKNYIGVSLQREFIHLKEKNDEREEERTPLYSETEDGNIIEDSNVVKAIIEKERLKETEIGQKLEENSRKMFEAILDFVEKKDGRAGTIKRIYKRDDRYKNYRQYGNDNLWVEEILANKRLEEEGNLAVNLAIFFVWWWNEERTAEGGLYGLKEYIEYVSDQTGNRLKKNTTTESDRQKTIFGRVSTLFQEMGGTEKNADLAHFFLRRLALEFEERKPKKIFEKNPEKEF